MNILVQLKVYLIKIQWRETSNTTFPASQNLAIYHWNFYVSSLGPKIVENSTEIIIQLYNNNFNHSQSMTCSLHNKIKC